jgi:hypothetical protein
MAPDAHRHLHVGHRVIFLALPVNVNQNSNADETVEKVGTTIANQWQRQALVGQ